MDPERMDFLNDLYQLNNNVIKTIQYESIYRNVFFNQEKYIQEASTLIQKYDNQINLMRGK